MSENIEAIRQIQQEIAIIKEENETFSKVIESLKIDKQLFLRANEKIRPGIAAKVAYDENGLIISGEELDQSDIPELSIDKIKNLRDSLADKASRKDLKNISVNLDEIFQVRDIAHTGCKVNYDRYGVIQSSTDLSPEDIPTLSLDHIEGLNEQLQFIKDSIPQKEVSINHPTVSPNTATKVTFDEHGHIVGHSKLDMNDIPIEIINRLNELESMIPLMASSKTLEAMNKTMSKKVDRDNYITPGTYNKFKVNQDGVITEASNMTVNDLPEIGIENIRDLYKTLKEKAEHSDVVELISSVSILMNYMNSIGDLTAIKNKVDRMVTESTISGLSGEIDELRKALNKISNIDVNSISQQLEEFNKGLSDINGRITVIEQKLQN